MRKTTILMVFSFAAGAAMATVGNSVLNAQFRTAESKQILRADLGSWCPGKEVTIAVQESGPGASGKHYHPAHSFSWIIEGSETRTVEGQPEQVAHAGDVIEERPMEVGETHNTASVKLLIFRIIEKGKPETTRVQ